MSMSTRPSHSIPSLAALALAFQGPFSGGDDQARSTSSQSQQCDLEIGDSNHRPQGGLIATTTTTRLVTGAPSLVKGTVDGTRIEGEFVEESTGTRLQQRRRGASIASSHCETFGEENSKEGDQEVPGFRRHFATTVRPRVHENLELLEDRDGVERETVTAGTSYPSETENRAAGAVSPARPSAVTTIPGPTTSTSTTPSTASSTSTTTTSSRSSSNPAGLLVTEPRRPAVAAVQAHIQPSIVRSTSTSATTIATASQDRGLANALSSGGPIAPAATVPTLTSVSSSSTSSSSSGIWTRFYSGLFSSTKSRRGGDIQTFPPLQETPQETVKAEGSSVKAINDHPVPAPVTHPSPGSRDLSDGVSQRTANETSSHSTTNAPQERVELQVVTAPGSLEWSRTSSFGGLLSSAYEYIVSVSRSVSVAGSPLLPPVSTDPTPSSSFPTDSALTSTTTETLAVPRPGPPAAAASAVTRSYSLSSRLHAAYQAILAPSSTSILVVPPTAVTRQHLIQSEALQAHTNTIRRSTTISSTPTFGGAPGRGRSNSNSTVTSTGRRQRSVEPQHQHPHLDTEALLNGQQRSGALDSSKVYRRNTLNNASPGKGSGSGSGGGSRRDAASRHATAPVDYYKDREMGATSPPPLPIPNGSMSRGMGMGAGTGGSSDGDRYYRQQQQQYQQQGSSGVSRPKTPSGTATTTTSGSPSRRNTIDSVSASFSSFYTSATSLAASSNREPLPGSGSHRSSREKERPPSRGDHHHLSSRAMSPDLYSQANVNIQANGMAVGGGSTDPYAALRLEDRCRHLEKTVKELQGRLKSKDQEIKMRESELRSREVELRSKDMELRQKEGEVREKEAEVRRRENDLRDREEELREVEGMLRDTEVQVRRRDEELEKYRAREQQWQWELQKQRLQAEKDAGQNKSMKELVDHTKEHVQKLERELKRRATASALAGGGQRKQHNRHNSLDIDENAASTGSDEGKMSTSAPSSVHLSKAYAESKRNKQEAALSESSSSSISSSSISTTKTGQSNQMSPGTSPSPSRASSRSQHHRPPPTSLRNISIPKTKSPAAPPASILPFTEEHAQKRSDDEFLTRTDSWSGAQVLQAVNDINSEIVQFAAVVTEMCRFAPREVPSPSPSPTPYSGHGARSPKVHPDEPASANPLLGTKPYTDTAARLGGALTHLLATYDHSNDPILVQLALQACVTIAAKRAWESFCLGLPAKSDGVLSVIYRSLRELEPQPTSSKWRSLTHGHIHAIYPTLAAYSANELAETMLRWTLDILVLAGCVRIESSASTPTASTSPSGPDSLANYGLSLPQGNSAATLRTQHTVSLILPQLLHITTALTRLENVLRQDILSTSFDLVIPECGMMYGKEWMVDFFGFTSSSQPSDGAAARNDRADEPPTKVLGSVEVGLMCRTRVGMRGASTPVTPSGASGSILGGQGTNMSQQQQGGGGTGAIYEERLLLMPKVLLESVVDLL